MQYAAPQAPDTAQVCWLAWVGENSRRPKPDSSAVRAAVMRAAPAIVGQPTILRISGICGPRAADEIRLRPPPGAHLGARRRSWSRCGPVHAIALVAAAVGDTQPGNKQRDPN